MTEPNRTETKASRFQTALQLDTPWKLTNEIKRILVLPVVRIQFMLSGIQWGKGWRIHGIPMIQKHRGSTIIIGAGLGLRSTACSNPLSPNHPVVLSTRRAGAILVIGDNFAMTGGSIVVEESVAIGNNVTVGANTIIADTDFHPLCTLERQMHANDGATAPIVIEDDVFIGTATIILKGVTIGKGSVVGAGSVVPQDIPPGVIAAGNPAHVVRKLA